MVVPVGRELVPTTNGGAFTVMLNDWLTLCEASWSLTVNVEVAAAVGLPEIVPVDDSVSPAGNGPDPGARLQVYGKLPPVPLSV